MSTSTPFDCCLEGAVCAVTGGAKGIGREIAALFRDLGCTVHVLDIDRAAMTAWRKSRGPGAAGIEFHPTDASDPAAVKETFRRIRRLDILVNNAGTPGYKPLDRMTRAAWDRTLRNNLDAAFQCSREALGKLRKSDRPAIVNISSIEARISESGTAHYSSAKGAIEAFTRALAVELGPEGIRVNAVAPGAITVEHNRQLFRTPPLKRQFKDRIPLGGRPGEAMDIARAVVFLASPLASYITGTVLQVDGGWSAKA